ncbi:hypothetical protein [Niabella ginsengisoli]|uniref:Uncharacterized protein n=1 Tax=Niabella ginsengisoli TaxID=522298 RepID=A0ABS9SIB9_9BACT|nr:hypothetical protein [Niabella ginsengisoli]MCH5598104.1 hypothetical protein [Niabella ginsengisoli]
MLKNKPQYDIKVASENFPSGVARFTIYNEAGIPVNEQAIFVWHDDALKMNLQTNKPDYINKDSVLLSLSVKNKNNEQMPGSFSIAVIDTSQVEIKTDAENILSYMLLSAELKGKVEAPYYYIKHPYSEATKALMLTQAWVRYVLNDTLRKYDYEKEFTINGKVTNLFNKPSPNTKVTLFGRQGQYGVFLKTRSPMPPVLFPFKIFLSLLQIA